jgi:hypothetical protein
MGYAAPAHRGIGTPGRGRFNARAMAAITTLDRFTVPLGGQSIELQEVVHAEGGMALLRLRVREGKRFTVFDVDPATARRWGEAMAAWARRQPG